MPEEKVIFVFYTFGTSGGSWRYPKLPKGWKWVGAGTTSPSVGESIESQYDFEEQFSGEGALESVIQILKIISIKNENL